MSKDAARGSSLVHLAHYWDITVLWIHSVTTQCVRMQVSSIEGCFDRRLFRSTKSIRSKTRVSSIEECNYCLSLRSTKVSGQVDVFSLPNVRSEHTPLEKLIFFSRPMDKLKGNIFLARWKKKSFQFSYFFFFFWEKLTIVAPQCSFYTRTVLDSVGCHDRSHNTLKYTRTINGDSLLGCGIAENTIDLNILI